MTPAYALYRRSRAYQDLSIEEQRQAVRAWAAEHGYRRVSAAKWATASRALDHSDFGPVVRAVRSALSLTMSN